MKNNIMVIGTVPPCPRCRLLTEILTSEVKVLGIDAEIRHISYTSDEALVIAEKLGLKPGTAKEVADKLGVGLNTTSANVIEVQALQWDDKKNKHLAHLKSLFKEVNILDNRLRFLEDAAEDNGILMTPVFMINGRVLYKGSVPNIDFIVKALSEL